MWNLVVGAVAGRSHLSTGKPCEDNVTGIIYENCLIGAVCDGLGSAAKAQQGSLLASDAAAESVLLSCLKHGLAPTEKGLQHALIAAQDKLTVQAALDESPIRDYSSTLLLVAANEEKCLTLCVGDGFVVIRHAKANNYTLCSTPFQPDCCNQTQSITRLTTPPTAQSHGPVEFICAGSDGLQHLALEYRGKWHPHQAFFSSLEQSIRASRATPDDGCKQLTAFLQSDKLQERTDDDTSLLVAWQV